MALEGMFEEEAAYALASWRRFDDEVTDELAGAVSSAFALVAVADGDLAEAEIDRFVELLRRHAGVLSPLDLGRIEPLFRDLAGAIFTDPAAGRRRALEHIAAVAGNPTHRDLVRAAAEIAVAADGKVLDSERSLLDAISGAMEGSPG